MIHITLPGFIILYLLGLISGIFVLWLIGEVTRFRELRRVRKSRTLCRVCGVIYEDRSKNPLPVCPVCKHPNERSDFQQV
jgi:prepilin signal peptidase PulO-like enzyme (type II secretory pathway)